MWLIIGNMNGEWFVVTRHISEEQAWKISIKYSDSTGHKHYAIKEENAHLWIRR